MTDRENERQDIKPGQGRVLILLDGSRTSYSALEEAAEIAARRGADVLGVFVEEVNLLRSAGYGFTREVGAASGISRPFDPELLEQRMRLMARQARQALTRAMAGRSGRHDLRVARGSAVAELLALARPDDLLVLGLPGVNMASGLLPGSPARGLIRESPARVLLWCEQRVLQRSRVVVVLNDHSEANHRTMGAAADASRHYHRPLTVLVLPGSQARELEAAVRRDPAVSGMELRVRTLPSADSGSVARVLREEGASCLVIGRDNRLFQAPGSDRLLAQFRLPVIITP